MADAKHTPGPWIAAPWTCHAATSVLAENKQLIADCAHSDAFSEANARLIAAAPELLTAVKTAYEFFINPHKFNPLEVEQAYQAAIAKAEGR